MARRLREEIDHQMTDAVWLGGRQLALTGPVRSTQR